MGNFNGVNSGDLVRLAAWAAGGVMAVAGFHCALKQPEKLPPSTLEILSANITSAGKSVVGAPSAAFKGLQNLISPPPKKPTTTPLLRAAQACLGFGVFLAAATILQKAVSPSATTKLRIPLYIIQGIAAEELLRGSEAWSMAVVGSLAHFPNHYR